MEVWAPPLWQSGLGVWNSPKRRTLTALGVSCEMDLPWPDASGQMFTTHTRHQIGANWCPANDPNKQGSKGLDLP